MHASVFIALAKFRHLSGITGDYILTGLFHTSRERTGDKQLLNAVHNKTCEETFIWSTDWKQHSVIYHEEILTVFLFKLSHTHCNLRKCSCWCKIACQ